MDINPEIFKAYDIRGIYKKDFDDESAYKIGLAFADFLKQARKNKKTLKIIIGADMRTSSPAIKKMLIKGIIGAGADAIDIGLVSTPTFYYAVSKYRADGGLMITASHNPAEYNGFKLVREKSLPIGRDSGIMDIKKLVVEANGRSPLDIAPTKKGKIIKQKGTLESQIKHDLKYAKIKKIKPFKIVVDSANGMGAQFISELFKFIPGKLIKMNWLLDGSFPAHEADPLKEKNILPLCERVKKEKADLGIATDGDGDRIFFVDNLGRPVEAGIARAIFAKIFLQQFPKSKIAYDIRPGKITEDVIRENKGKPVVTPVGHSFIKLAAIKEGAVFAGESSGHFFLNMGAEGCYETPVIMILKLLEELSQSNLSFAEYLKPYQRYFHSGEINFRVATDPDKIIEKIEKKYKDGKITRLDILSVEYPNFWFNVRKSNTEPLLRLNVEASTKEIMEKKRDEIKRIIEK